MCIKRCVYPRCNYILEDSATPSFQGGGYTHGLCPVHERLKHIERYRQQQLNDGNFVCAGMSTGLCDQTDCTYYPVCNNMAPEPADYLEVERRQGPRRTAKFGSPCGCSYEGTRAIVAG